MYEMDNLGADWLAELVDDIVETVTHVSPVEFNERTRYLPESVTRYPGFIRFDVNPYMREIIDAADPRSDVREVNLKKGVQITYTTVLESILFYYMDHIKTRPCMFISADKELVQGRIENAILPMLNQSGRAHIIRSSDEGNGRKTGKTKDHLQWEGGGFLVPAGANNADKLRMWSILLMLKDELDGWKDVVGKDGDPDALTDDRCSAMWDIRKIFRGSTPLVAGSSKIQYQFERGDQRVYRVLCRSCGFPQPIRWHVPADEKTGVIGGIKWETEGGQLINESVRWHCCNCGHGHEEYEKTALFAEENGAHWHPTARPQIEGVRSYHLPAMYSPVGFQPWYKCVDSYLAGFDPVKMKVRDIGKYQRFYNNILGEPFRKLAPRLRFEAVSAHRRQYVMDEIPNKWAIEHVGDPVSFIVCQVDVHKSNLAVSVVGFTRGLRSFLIRYERWEDKDCTEPTSPVWAKLRQLVSAETVWHDDTGRTYRIASTFVDSGYANATVAAFCAEYAAGVYAIVGRQNASKNQALREFGTFETKAGGQGYVINVDYYKDRLAPVMRREWSAEAGPQPDLHFNAPLDTTDDQLKELTVEYVQEKTSVEGITTQRWYRPQGVNNELWDLSVYSYAQAEVLAYNLCTKVLGLKAIEWATFWDFIEENNVYFTNDRKNG